MSPDGGFFDLPLAHAQCCFTAETLVLMADGTERPIAELRPGDQVIGRAGVANRVTGMHIVPLGPRLLYGINQQNPFFTAEHPFLTPGGWRALDRAATQLEIPGLDVAELTAGDVLITAAAVSGETAGALALAPAVSFGHLVLQWVTIAEGDPTDRVYNLTLDGDHSYVANGFVVHNKDHGGDESGGGENPDDTAVVGKKPPADATGVEFSGSATPAGPDLSASEERALIAAGWN